MATKTLKEYVRSSATVEESAEEIKKRFAEVELRRRGILPPKKNPYEKYQLDPVGYSRDVLKVAWSPQQIEIAQALVNHRQVMVKASHAVGKCIPLSEKVMVANGIRRTGHSILHGRGSKTLSIMSMSEDGEMGSFVAHAEANGVQPIWRIQTSSGRTIRRTSNHPLYVGDKSYSKHRPLHGILPRGFTALSEVVPGDFVAVPSNISGLLHANKHNLDELKLVAYMIGDGGMIVGSPTFTQMDGVVLDEVNDIIKRFGCTLHPHGQYSYLVTSGSGNARKKGANPVTNMLRRWGVYGKHSRDKVVPERVFNSSLRQLRIFLSRLFATDGWASLSNPGLHTGNKARAEIGFCSVSRQLCADIQELLLRFGISANLFHKPKVNAWVLSIDDCLGVVAFADKIGIYGKEDAVAKCRKRANEAVNSLHGPATTWRTRRAPANCRWEEVVSCEYDCEEDTVAICVPETGTYFTTFYEHNSHLAGGLISWFFDSYSPSKTISTAPSSKQITDVIWAEVRSQRAGRPGLLPKAARLEDPGNPHHFAVGMTAASAEGFQGRHENAMFIIMDEATGIHPQFWEAAKGMISGGTNVFWLAILNPTTTACRAYQEYGKLDANDNPIWHTITVSALEHDNIRAELAGETPRYPAAIRLHGIESAIAEDCHPILITDAMPGRDFEFPPSSGLWYRPGAIFEGHVLGRWPTEGTDSVWSEGHWNAAMYVRLSPGNNKTVIGCDVARFGDDNTEICVRKGPCVLHMEKHNGWNTTQTATRLKELCHQYSSSGENARDIKCNIDDTGVGSGVTDQRGDFAFVPINSSDRAIEAEKYPNKRSELWFTVAKRAMDGDLDLSRLSSNVLLSLKVQAMTPVWSENQRGQRVVEPKSITKKRIGRSPDGMDALNLAFAVGKRKGRVA